MINDHVSDVTRALSLILDPQDDYPSQIHQAQRIIPSRYVHTYGKNDMIITMNDMLNNIYILVRGEATVFGSLDNNGGVIARIEPIEILGLLELLFNQTRYTAFVMAETDCLVFKIPAAMFHEIIQTNSTSCYYTLKTLARVTAKSMTEAATKRLLSPFDIIGYYLYLQAQHELPYTCPHKRENLATILNINLRTMYRHIDSLKNQGFLTIQKGKIIVEQQHFTLLNERYSAMII